MRIRTVILGTAAAFAASAPIVAQAAEGVRAAAPVAGASDLGYPESASQLVVLALIAAAIIGGIALFDEDEPTSP